MTMPPIGLKKIENYNKEELKIFLKSNNITACSRIFELEDINGKTFLTLSRTDFSKWKKIVGESEVKVFKNFLKEIKSKPDAFIPSTSTNSGGTPTISAKAGYQTTKKKQSLQVTIEHINVVEKDVKAHRHEEVQRVKVFPDELIQPQKPVLPPVLPKRCLPMNQKHETKPELQQSKSIYDSKYYLKIDRQEAETLLKTTSKDGAYLFRPSTKHHCAFSVYFENDVRHFAIKLVEGKLEFVSVGNDVRFNSLEEIVRYFSMHPELHTANARQAIILSNHVYSG